MPISVASVLGVLFLVLAFVSTYLMFHFWRYPYDKERRKSECPQWKMNIHRGVGYAYAIVYVVMMTQMVPRLWQYQVEFPARTVAHIMLGFTIGVLLILKISILRWFRHFEEWMPALGVSLLLCTVLLTGLSLPFVVRERLMASSEETFSAANRARVRQLLAGAGLPAWADLDELASEGGLRRGRRVLLEECTFCHDLRTAISRPRTPEDWMQTAERMAEKPTLGPEVDPLEVQQVAAYLVAITPELQASARAKRAEELGKEEALEAARALEDEAAGTAPADAGVPAPGDAGDAGAQPAAPGPTPRPAPAPRPKRPPPDPAAARTTFEAVCSKCHELDDVAKNPPRSVRQTGALIQRMVENGMEASRKEIQLIRWYLIETYVKKQ